MCDRIVIISEGKIVADDTAANLSDHFSKDRRLQVAIAGPRKEVADLLGGITGVDSVKALGSRESGVEEFAVEVRPGTDIRRDLFTRLAQRNWPLLSSKSMAMSLEDIFINLTLHQNGGVK